MIKYAEIEKDNIGYLAEEILSMKDSENILLKSFLIPSAHSPALFGLCPPEATVQNYTEAKLLNVISSESVVSNFNYVFSSSSPSFTTHISTRSVNSTNSISNYEYDHEFDEDSDIDTLSTIMKTPAYSHSLIFTKNDLILLDFLYTLVDIKQTAESIPALEDGIELLLVRTEIDLLHQKQNIQNKKIYVIFKYKC